VHGEVLVRAMQRGLRGRRRGARGATGAACAGKVAVGKRPCGRGTRHARWNDRASEDHTVEICAVNERQRSYAHVDDERVVVPSVGRWLRHARAASRLVHLVCDLSAQQRVVC
jgi:hypothetical protein